MDVIEDTAPAAIATKTVINIDTVAAVIAADMATRFGQTVDATPQDVTKARIGDGVYASLAISQDLGIFKMVVASADVGLRCEPVSDGTVWVLVDLRYEHIGGGRNGHTVGTYWLRDGKIENFRGI